MIILSRTIRVLSFTVLGLLCGLMIEAQARDPSEPSSGGESPTIEALIQGGEWQKAYDLAGKQLRIDSRAPIALFVRSLARQVALMEAKPGEALGQYDYPFTDAAASDKLKHWVATLVEANPSNKNVQYVIAAHRLLAENDVDQATSILEKVLATEPDQVFALAAVGATYGAANRLDDAMRVSEKAISINPNCAPAYSNLGMVAMSRRDYGRAEEYFKKATSLRSAGAMEWFNLGSLYYFQRRMSDARKALEKSLALSPNLIETRYNLAGVCYNLGDKASAIKHLRLLLEVAPNSSYSSKARQNLRQLGESEY